ncbi:hypothetical protein NIES37_06160 [Tolypothrix tenuis PCC 7101]|uniref:Uncharacterized protein n=2 Tax=Tolypothrix TaxID=111782 RepID=A0A1Z4MTD1_9CYAN|nr:hypothetical protein NIES37_06160 [Tolypothrix tenuis PCC 7101]BAZ72812.1 hypothetical protein NIES50_13680 [Aulosira laxa NIES-50]
MMLAQFQSLYPKGSIISELVQIFQGKYIVRVSVQIEGVTRTTGLAAAETIEAAEDNARNRALMVLGTENAPQETVVTVPPPASPLQAHPDLNKTSKFNESAYSPSKEPEFGSSQWSVPGSKEVSILPDNGQHNQPDKLTTDIRSASKSDTYSPEFGQPLPINTELEAQFDTPGDLDITSSSEPEILPLSDITPSNVKPFTPRSYSSSEDVGTPTVTTGKKRKKSEPVDLSDVIAKTDVELQRLGWTPEQGREHLIKTYGKRGRTLLTEDELHGFLQYLESQPTPKDPLMGF